MIKTSKYLKNKEDKTGLVKRLESWIELGYHFHV